MHPFDAKKRIIKESEPKPLYLLYEELNIGLSIEHAHFLIEDEIIKDINKIPNDGQTVYIAVHPGGTPEGTGKGMAIGGALAILAGILVTAISLGSLTGVGVALIGTGIGMLAGGAVLLNLDIPNLKDREKPKQNPSIRGAKNRANQLGFIPVVLGRHLIYPDMAANPHFEIEGNDQYLIQLFCAGYNDIEIEKDSIKLGDTLLKEYSETKNIDKILAGEDSVVKLQILKSGEECSFYKKAVKDENINQLLKHSFEDGKDGSIIRTTPSKTTKINVDIFFYSGLGRYNDEGEVVSTSVEVACYYKKENAPDSHYSLLGFFNGNKNVIEGKELKTKRFQITKEGLPPDKYTLKFTRVTQDSEDNKMVDAVYVGSIRSFTDDRPIRFERQKNLTIVALKIKATERLNGIIDSLNFIAQSKIPAYKGSGQGPASWEEKLTSNPAAILKYVLQGKINSNPVSNEDIDWESFEKWALWCDEKKYSCNAVLSDKATLSELITMITHTARADAVKIDSKFSIVQDVERLSPVQLFTPRNTKSYSQSLLFADIPEAIEFNFIDEASGFKENERIVYDTPTGEPTETEALKKQQETLWGVTNAMQAFKIGRYQYACMHNRPRVHKIDVDLEFLVCTKGDRIQYAGDIGLIGIAYGRVKGVETLSGLTTAVILDEYIEAEKGKTYALRFRKKDGRILIVDTRPLSASYTNKIEFELALNENDAPQEGDLFTFGIKQKECLDLIITSIEPTDEWNASIIAVDYSPEIFGIDDSSYVVPPFDNKITNIDGNTSDSGSVEQWKYYYTYNDSEEEPLRPKYDGTRDGWHRLQTKKSIWVSTKNAKSVYEGQWSAPVRLKGEKGEQGIPGKDGMTKFLASLEIQGDYENQIGTYQGQLYRWVNNKWELLNAVMPLNPVVFYDFEDLIHTNPKNIIYQIPSPIFENKKSNIVPPQPLPNNQIVVIETSCSFTGNANPILGVYKTDWSELFINKRLNGNENFSVYIPKEGSYWAGIWMNGLAGYVPQNGDSVTLSKFIIAKRDKTVLDKSGNKNHSEVIERFKYKKDVKVGTTLQFFKGYLTRPPQDFIDIGKKWSHSRWIKINPEAQDKNTNPRLWRYSSLDYSFFDIAANNGKVNDVTIATYKDNSSQNICVIEKNKMLNNQWHNLIVCNDIQTSYARKIIYLDGKKIHDKTVNKDFSNLINTENNTDMAAWNDCVKGSLANLIFFDRLLTEQEILWLALNPQYPIKNYTLADWSISPVNPDNVLASATPKYLGMVETVPDTRTATITKGERLGAVDANPGDWVLSGKTIGGWKVGVCYRWSGVQWVNLEPEVNYAEDYQACLVHMFQIEELKNKTGHFGALFAQMLVAQEAFIKKLSGDIAFLNRLIVKKLHIDTDNTTNQDFEAWFDERNGLKIRNKGEEIFRVDTNGGVFAKKAFLQDGIFTGEIFSGPLRLSPQKPTAKEINVKASETAKDICNRLGIVSYSVKSKDGIDNIYGFNTYIQELKEDYESPGFGIVGWRKVRIYYVFIPSNSDTAVFGETIDKGKYPVSWWGPIPDVDFSETNKNFTRDYHLEVLSGGKTFVLLDLPKQEPALTGAVWTNGSDGILRIKN